MRMKLAALAALTALITSGLIVTTLLPASSTTNLALYVKRREGFVKYINANGEKSAAGDYIVYSRPLYQSGTGQEVGRVTVQRTLIHRLGKHDARFRLAATFSLRKDFALGRGTVEVAGYNKVSTTREGFIISTFAVTGGTKKYNGASGQLLVWVKDYRTHFTLLLINP